MKARLTTAEPAQMIAVEIYETGEKKFIPVRQIAKNTNRLNSTIIVTAAEYRSYRPEMMIKQSLKKIFATS